MWLSEDSFFYFTVGLFEFRGSCATKIKRIASANMSQEEL